AIGYFSVRGAAKRCSRENPPLIGEAQDGFFVSRVDLGGKDPGARGRNEPDFEMRLPHAGLMSQLMQTPADGERDQHSASSGAPAAVRLSAAASRSEPNSATASA